MLSKPVDFKTSKYFPGSITFMGVVLIAVGLFAVINHVMVGLVLFFVSFLILSTHYRLSIDVSTKTYRDYLWILGFRSGETESFDEIQYLYITKGKVSQTINSRISSTTITSEAFYGFIKFSEDDKIQIVSKDNKEAVVEKLKSVSALLKLRIFDYCDGGAVEVK